MTFSADLHLHSKTTRATSRDCDLETGDGFGGTVELFPDEGKYHYDGHRRCGVRPSPRQTREREGRCPACGKPVTVGVMHRVEVLADRDEGSARPGPTPPYSSLLALDEVIAQVEGVGRASRRVGRIYHRLLHHVGSELHILKQAPVEEIASHGSPILGEAVSRMRTGDVRCEAGFDGEYGVIRLFDETELLRRDVVGLLFEPEAQPPSSAPAQDLRPASPREEKRVGAPPRAPATPFEAPPHPAPAAGTGVALDPVQVGLFEAAPCGQFLAPLDPEQRQAAGVLDRPLLILAGPGDGQDPQLELL